MATHDHMDLDVRSQAFLKDFYHFYKNSCDAWYIKDANHRFMDASITFLSRFLPPDLTSVIGLGDDDVSDASPRDISIMHEFESIVMFERKEIIIFALGYFNDCNDIKSFVLKMKPWGHADEVDVIVYISDLFEINKKVDWLSLVVPGKEDIASNAGTTSSSCINPRSYLTENEWTVAWLVICGLSLRNISTLIDMKRQSVDLKISHAYIKLGVFNRDGLLKMANQHRWVNFIPDRFVTGFNIIRVN